jgi:hypothetical protein
VAIIVLLLLPWVLLRSWTAPLYFVGVSVLVVAVMLIPIQGFREIGSMLFVLAGIAWNHRNPRR